MIKIYGMERGIQRSEEKRRKCKDSEALENHYKDHYKNHYWNTKDIAKTKMRNVAKGYYAK